MDRQMLRTRAFLAAIAVLAALSAPAAFADFRVVEMPKPASASDAAGPSAPPSSVPTGYVPLDGGGAPASTSTSSAFGLVAVSFVGTPPSVIEARQGMGRDVRLADALRQIAPSGWRGFVKPEFASRFNRDRRVNWRGGRRWVDVLDIVANENDIAIEVNWPKKHLYIGERRAAARPAAPATPPPPEQWQAAKGATLRAVVEAWAARARWSVVWSASDLDYPIIAPMTFEGPFDQAIANLIRAYEHSDRPLAIDINRPQRAALVSEKK